MKSASGGLLVFAVVAAAALLSLWLYPHLPERYRSDETTKNLRLGMGVIATITAVVLGLLISSVKGQFDQVNRDTQAFGAELTVLDRTLRFYGPDGAVARDLLARYTERVLDGTFPPGGRAPMVDDRVAEDLLNQTERAIVNLPPDQQSGRREQALTEVRGLVLRRQMLIAESGSAVSVPIVVVLTLWLALLFGSFGHNAPRNGMMVVILLVCAASVATAIALILEIDHPFSGLMVVSSEPIQHALSVMRR